MRKFALGYLAVLFASSVAATLGHMYCREFCIATKPVLWPIAYMVFFMCKVIVIKNRKDRSK